MKTIVLSFGIILMTVFFMSAQSKFSDTLPSIRYGDTILYVYPTDNSLVGWGGYGTKISVYNGAEDKWDGTVNTIAIVKQLRDNGGVSYAAKVCDTLLAFGYNDWYLPSMHELDSMYFKKDSIGEILVLGEDGIYWSSTEANSSDAVGVYFGHFYMRASYSKNHMYACRCVRRDLNTIQIPDDNLKTALIDLGIDLNGDEKISDFEARLINILDVSGSNDSVGYDIKDMTGIEAFINLDTLDCSRNNNLSVLDVSALVNLEYLNCSESAMIGLDLSQNTSLKTISLGKNPFLTEVCVWELPFPPAGVLVDTAGSPNLFFTTECSQNVSYFFQDGNNIKIFPNPAHDMITVMNGKPIQTTVNIIDLNGKVVYSNELNAGSLHIDVSLFPPGVYMVKVTGYDNRILKKLVIK
jgi:hypothetical protein